MDTYWLLLLLPIATGSGWYAATRAFSRQSKIQHWLPSEYFRGLTFLLSDEPDKALEILVTALEKDKDTVEVQLALGSLFRKRGEIQRATRVHQNLVARTQLDASQKIHALYELAQDYYKAGLFDRAEHLLLEIGSGHELDESAKQLLLKIYEQEKEWRNAIEVAKNLESFREYSLGGIIAHYHCEIAENALSEGRYDVAGKYIQLARFIDGDCVRGIIQSGRLLAAQGDHRGAISEWVYGASLHSELPGEVIGLIHNSYKIINALDEYGNFLSEMLKTRDDNRLVLALTEYLRDNEGEEAAELFLLTKIRSSPSVSGFHRLIQLRLSKADGQYSGDLSLLERLIGSIDDGDSGYECRHCGFQGKMMHWNCPGCRNWNTTQIRIRRALTTHKDDVI